MAESLGAGWDRLAPLFDEFGPKAEDLLKTLIANSGVEVLAVNHRLKSRASAIGKADRATPALRDIDDIHDLLGLRVITYFADDVDKVAALIEGQFEIDAGRTKDKRASLDPDRFGYLSVHYGARLNAQRRVLAEWSLYSNVWFEVQIRSVLQHAWAEIEHDLGYKSTAGSVPNEFRRRFSRLAGVLEIADEQFGDLRAELEEYEHNVQNRSGGVRDEDVNQVTMQAFIESNPSVRSADEAIALGHGSRIVSANPVAVRLRAEEMVARGLKSTDAVEKILVEELDLVVPLAIEWLNQKSAEEAHDPESRGDDGHYLELPRGISLFYLSRLLKSVERGQRVDDSDTSDEFAFEQLRLKIMQQVRPARGDPL